MKKKRTASSAFQAIHAAETPLIPNDFAARPAARRYTLDQAQLDVLRATEQAHVPENSEVLLRVAGGFVLPATVTGVVCDDGTTYVEIVPDDTEPGARLARSAYDLITANMYDAGISEAHVVKGVLFDRTSDTFDRIDRTIGLLTFLGNHDAAGTLSDLRTYNTSDVLLKAWFATEYEQ